MKCLVLNLDFTPLAVVPMKRAIVLSMRDTKDLVVLSYYDKEIKSENQSTKVPAVILYAKHIKITARTRPSKRSILLRDGMTCQYCSVDLTKKGATIDHVKPISSFRNRSKANTWDNMVACCKSCNIKKGDKSLREVGMKLLKRPTIPRYFISACLVPDEWREYL